MVECACGLSFLLETMQTIAVLGKRRRQDLYRDIAVQLLVAGEIEFSHSACATFRADFITAKFCTGFQCQPHDSIRLHPQITQILLNNLRNLWMRKSN